MKKDHKESQTHKKKVIDSILTIDKDNTFKQQEMVQFSEEYLKKKYQPSSTLKEGYLHYLLEITELVEDFPFQVEDLGLDLKVSKTIFLKILQEIEDVNGEGTSIPITDIPDEYNVHIGGTYFKFTISQ
jgi:hypothetical protein